MTSRSTSARVPSPMRMRRASGWAAATLLALTPPIAEAKQKPDERKTLQVTAGRKTCGVLVLMGQNRAASTYSLEKSELPAELGYSTGGVTMNADGRVEIGVCVSPDETTKARTYSGRVTYRIGDARVVIEMEVVVTARAQ